MPGVSHRRRRIYWRGVAAGDDDVGEEVRFVVNWRDCRSSLVASKCCDVFSQSKCYSTVTSRVLRREDAVSPSNKISRSFCGSLRPKMIFCAESASFAEFSRSRRIV